jgi:hypothetical protein
VKKVPNIKSPILVVIIWITFFDLFLDYSYCPIAGLHVTTGTSYWRLMGTMGGVNGPEMRINTFESLLSYYFLHQTRNKRVAREGLRKASWSTLLWKNKMGVSTESKPGEEKTIFNHVHSQTFNLPRQLGENEKPFMLCMSHLFGYFREPPDNPELVQSLYFNVFMRAFSTLQVCSTGV